MPSKETFKILKVKASRDRIPMVRGENWVVASNEKENLECITNHFRNLIEREVLMDDRKKTANQECRSAKKITMLGYVSLKLDIPFSRGIRNFKY